MKLLGFPFQDELKVLKASTASIVCLVSLLSPLIV
jgi:hypothetical protein